MTPRIALQNRDSSRVASRSRLTGKNSGFLGTLNSRPMSMLGAAVFFVREDGCSNAIESSAVLGKSMGI